MAKVLLTCLPVLFAPSPSSELDSWLTSSLVFDLERLQKSLEDNPPTLQWCSEAISVIKRSHSHFLFYLETSNLIASWETVNKIDEYLRATLDLLDLCNFLKSAVSNLDRHRMLIEFMVKRLEAASFSTASGKIELQRLETEKNNKIFSFRKWKGMSLTKGVSNVKLKTATTTTMHVFQALRDIMSIISLVTFCSVLYSIPVVDEQINTGFGDSDTYSYSVQKLISTFGEKFQHLQGKRKPVLHEKDMMEEALAALKARTVAVEDSDEGKANLQLCADMLKNRSVAFKEGLDSFERVVDELFEDVLKGRRKAVNFITLDNHQV